MQGAVGIFILVGIFAATPIQAGVLCTNAEGIGGLQVRNACTVPEVLIDPADLGLDRDLVLYDAHGDRVGQIQGVMGGRTSSNVQAVVTFERNGHTVLALFVHARSGHALDLCLPEKRFCWKYQ